jgi:hypothetical protein
MRGFCPAKPFISDLVDPSVAANEAEIALVYVDEMMTNRHLVAMQQ